MLECTTADEAYSILFGDDFQLKNGVSSVYFHFFQLYQFRSDEPKNKKNIKHNR